MCFIDYKKAFDCTDDERMWLILKDMGVPTNLVVLLLKTSLRKSESSSQNAVWRDGRVRHRDRCTTGLHPVSFVILHLIIIIIIRQPLCPVVGRRPQHAVSKLPCLVQSSAISCRSSICPGRLSTQGKY